MTLQDIYTTSKQIAKHAALTVGAMIAGVVAFAMSSLSDEMTLQDIYTTSKRIAKYAALTVGAMIAGVVVFAMSSLSDGMTPAQTELFGSAAVAVVFFSVLVSAIAFVTSAMTGSILIRRKKTLTLTTQREAANSVADQIRSGEIKTLADDVLLTDINLKLKRGEDLLFRIPATFSKVKNVSRYQAGTAGTTLRVAKGVSFRLGGMKGKMVSSSELTSIGDGHLVITNQRVIFTGLNRPIVLSVEDLLSYEATEISVNFTNETGRYVATFSAPVGCVVDAFLDRTTQDV